MIGSPRRRSAPQDDTTTTAPDSKAKPDLGKATPAADTALVPAAYVRNYWGRVRAGDTGSAPAISGLVLLIILFGSLQSSFTSLSNIASMITDGAGPMLIAMGLVFVLLLGEIDLSAGYAAGVCAAVMVRLSSGYGLAWPIAIGAALVSGIVIGVLIGVLRAKVRIPSFVVTLAFFLAFQGVSLFIVNNGKGQTGDVTIVEKVVNAFNNGQMSVLGGWVLGVVSVLLYAGMKIVAFSGRRRAGLPGEPVAVMSVKIVATAVLVLGFIFLLNKNRTLNTGVQIVNVNGVLKKVTPPPLEGVPWVLPVIVFFFIFWTFILGRTRYGRHVYAVGGNDEAARRAGIPVDRIRISVFVVCSFMASVGGIMIGSNVKSVNVALYGGNLLLLAVGAAVIGGTSLFGGKGRVLDAVIGGAVVEVISNGMADLVSGTNGPAVQYVVTGLVLLLAAAIDALSRRRAGATGVG